MKSVGETFFYSQDSRPIQGVLTDMRLKQTNECDAKSELFREIIHEP